MAGSRNGVKVTRTPHTAGGVERAFEQTWPVVDHYRKANTVLEVDADQDVDIVSSQIFEKLDSLAGS